MTLCSRVDALVTRYATDKTMHVVPCRARWTIASCRLLLGTICALLVAAPAVAAGSAVSAPAEIELTVGGHSFSVELARTEAERMQGLARRRDLPENRGMLFVFQVPALHAMWMRNTYIPLSVAFLDAQGIIINIEDMMPHTLDLHVASRPAKFALEMKRGWFTARAIKPGMQVEGVTLAPAAR